MCFLMSPGGLLALIQVVARWPACCFMFCSPTGRPREREEEYEGRKRLALPHVVQLRSQVSLNGSRCVPCQIPSAGAALLTRSVTRSPLSRGASVCFPVTLLVFGLHLLVSVAARNDQFHPLSVVAQFQAGLSEPGSPGGSSIPVAGRQKWHGVFSSVVLLLDLCPSSLSNALP